MDNGSDPSRRPGGDIGRQLTKAREAARFSRARFARTCGITEHTLRRYERGATTPNWDMLCTFSDVLGVSLDYFRGDTEETRALLTHSAINEFEDAAQRAVRVLRRAADEQREAGPAAGSTHDGNTRAAGPERAALSSVAADDEDWVSPEEDQ